MNDNHIKQSVISLYVSGYEHLRDEVLSHIETHLPKCSVCSDRLNEQIREYMIGRDRPIGNRIISIESKRRNTDIQQPKVQADDTFDSCI